MVVKSATELNNAQQLWLSRSHYDALDNYLNGRRCELAPDELLRIIFSSVQKHYPCHAMTDEQILIACEKIKGLEPEEQLNLMKQIVAALHADPRRANLSVLGLPSEWKRFRNLSFNDEDEFIYQSPSGLFEKRITVAELKRRVR